MIELTQIQFQKLLKDNPQLPSLTAPRLTKYIPQEMSAKQQYFLCLNDVQEIMYGGAGGGGKSYALIMAALQYVDIPGYSAIIFRRTYPELSAPYGLIDIAKKWLLATDVRWNEQSKTFIFPSGATLLFRHMQHEVNMYDYQGPSFQFIAFDELTAFKQRMYEFLFSRLRKPVNMNIPLRVRVASNPGGIGHDWVKSMFIDDTNSRRLFIPAKLEDNPFIDRKKYEESLMHLDPITRAQILNGDWTVRHGGSIFKREWFKITNTIPANAISVRYWDLGATLDGDYSVGVKMYRDYEGNYYIADVIRGQWTPGQRDMIILHAAQLDGIETEIVIEQEGGSGGIAQTDSLIKLLAGFNISAHRPTGDKIVRASPFASQCEAGNVYILSRNFTNEYISELEGFPMIDHDDQVDASSGAFLILSQKNMTVSNTIYQQIDTRYNPLSQMRPNKPR